MRQTWNIVAMVVGILVLAIAGPWVVSELRSLQPQHLSARAGERVVTLEVAGMT
jgi:hypothetical protein